MHVGRDEVRALLGDIAFAEWMFSVSRAMSGNSHDAEDVFQSVCVSLLESFGRNPREAPDSWKSYVAMCIRNATISLWGDRTRRAESTAEVELLDNLFHVGLAPRVEELGDVTALRHCLQQLSTDQRNAVLAKLLLEISDTDMPAFLGVSYNACRGRVHRARQLLVECLASQGVQR